MRRAAAVALLLLPAVGFASMPHGPRPQPPAAVSRIGLLAFPAIPHGWVEPLLPQEPLRQALRDLGHMDGQNLAWVAFAPTRRDLLPALARDLLDLCAVGGRASEKTPYANPDGTAPVTQLMMATLHKGAPRPVLPSGPPRAGGCRAYSSRCQEPLRTHNRC